jgi:hypothetical protein
MSQRTFLLCVAALVGANIFARVVVLKGYFDGLPVMPREH